MSPQRTAFWLTVLAICVGAVVWLGERAKDVEIRTVDPRSQLDTYVGHDVSEFLFARDAMPSATDPGAAAASAAPWMADEDDVVGLVVDGVARAYPLRQLALHHIINDVVNGRAVAVTYCSACRSALAFEATHEGDRLTFGMDGAWRGAATMYDRESESVWLQLSGACITGPKFGAILPWLPAPQMTWRAWRTAHPETEVVKPDPRFEGVGGMTYPPSANLRRQALPPGMAQIIGDVDPRMKPLTLVFGLEHDGIARAYALSGLPAVVEEEVDGMPVTIWHDANARFIGAYDRRVGDHALQFEAGPDGIWQDASGSTWNAAGRCVAGLHEGRALTPLRGHTVTWYGWTFLHPLTTVWQPD